MNTEPIFKPWTVNELFDYWDSPEGKKVAQLLEQEYRRGYWDGVHQAVDFLQDGAQVRQLDHWLWDTLQKWRYGNFTEHIIPPKILPWSKLRKAILESYQSICVYCKGEATHVDHIMPVSRGGGDEVENLVAACKDCNLYKRARTPEEAGMEIKLYPVRELEIIEVDYYRGLRIRLKD